MQVRKARERLVLVLLQNSNCFQYSIVKLIHNSSCLNKETLDHEGVWISDLNYHRFSWFYYCFLLSFTFDREDISTLKTAFDRISKHLEGRQKYSPVHHIFNSLLVEHYQVSSLLFAKLHTCLLILVLVLLHLKIVMAIPQQCWTLAEKKTTNQLLLYLEKKKVKDSNVSCNIKWSYTWHVICRSLQGNWKRLELLRV